MAMQRAGFTALMIKDLRRVYIEDGQERPLEYPQVFNVEDMETNPIRHRQVSGLGAVPAKPEGTGFTRDEILLGTQKEFTADPFGLAVDVSWELWRDEQYGVMRDMVRGLSRASRHRQEVQAWSVLNNAFDNAFAGFDGVALCHTAHPGLDGVTRANRPSPDVGLSQTGMQAAILRFESMTNERNQPALLKPSMVVIHANNKFIAREVLGSAHKPYTADNEINALNAEDMSWMVGHYLTSLTAWFTMTVKSAHDLHFYFRDRPIFDAWDDEDTKGAVFSVYQRHTQGYSAWRGVDGTSG